MAHNAAMWYLPIVCSQSQSLELIPIGTVLLASTLLKLDAVTVSCFWVTMVISVRTFTNPPGYTGQVFSTNFQMKTSLRPLFHFMPTVHPVTATLIIIENLSWTILSVNCIAIMNAAEHCVASAKPTTAHCLDLMSVISNAVISTFSPSQFMQ